MNEHEKKIDEFNNKFDLRVIFMLYKKNCLLGGK